jgi:hypothetical protein
MSRIKSFFARAWLCRAGKPVDGGIGVPPADRISFQEMANEFEELYETRLSPSGSLVLRGAYRGSFQTCRRQIEQHVRQYLDSKDRSGDFTRDLVEDFRFYLVAGSESLAPGQIHNNNNNND